jgi:hypothetical protein
MHPNFITHNLTSAAQQGQHVTKSLMGSPKQTSISKKQRPLAINPSLRLNDANQLRKWVAVGATVDRKLNKKTAAACPRDGRGREQAIMHDSINAQLTIPKESKTNIGLKFESYSGSRIIASGLRPS